MWKASCRTGIYTGRIVRFHKWARPPTDQSIKCNARSAVHRTLEAGAICQEKEDRT